MTRNVVEHPDFPHHQAILWMGNPTKPLDTAPAHPCARVHRGGGSRRMAARSAYGLSGRALAGAPSAPRSQARTVARGVTPHPARLGKDERLFAPEAAR